VLQDGLVERDTEVGSTASHMHLTGFVDQACLLGRLRGVSACFGLPCMPVYHIPDVAGLQE
jgi:hypothetical protein